jgi:hypothetical protein
LAVFLLTFLLVLLAITGLALGVLMGRKPLEGSCGTAHCTKIMKCAGCPSRDNGGDA